MNDIGVVIKRARLRKRLSQDEVAAKVGISRVQLSNIERGVHVPKFSTVEKLCEVLGIGAKEIMK